MDKNDVIKILKEYKSLLETQLQFEKMYLFGSYAKDENTDNSDIDVAIVASNISGDYFAVNPLLWKLRRQIDDRIEPILIDRCNDQSGFLDEILEHGIVIE